MRLWPALFLAAIAAPAGAEPHGVRLRVDEAARAAADTATAPPERLTHLAQPLGTPRRLTASMDLGKTRLFAFSGRLAPRERDAFADMTGLAAVRLPDRARLVSGKSVGAGASRRLGRFEIESRAAFARASTDSRDPTSVGMGAKARAASLTAGIRLGF